MLKVVEDSTGTLYLDVDSTLETMICTGSLDDARWLLDQKIPDFQKWKHSLQMALIDLSTAKGTVSDFKIEVKKNTRITATVSYDGGKGYEYRYPKGNLTLIE